MPRRCIRVLPPRTRGILQARLCLWDGGRALLAIASFIIHDRESFCVIGLHLELSTQSAHGHVTARRHVGALNEWSTDEMSVVSIHGSGAIVIEPFPTQEPWRLSGLWRTSPPNYPTVGQVLQLSLRFVSCGPVPVGWMKAQGMFVSSRDSE